EVYHFAVFQTALEGIRELERRNGPDFPDIEDRPHKGDVMPEPCAFLDKSLPVCSVIRPRNTNTAGAVAAATGLVKSGLFEGQSAAFFNAVVALATAADAAVRS
ncbi:MAG: ferritin-like domain-containing protein, partial [Candidatus Acidiferrum sp.]